MVTVCQSDEASVHLYYATGRDKEQALTLPPVGKVEKREGGRAIQRFFRFGVRAFAPAERVQVGRDGTLLKSREKSIEKELGRYV